MPDFLSKQQRSERMSRIRSRDTGPELAIRKHVFSMGYRYRLHQRNLPGCPDLVFASRRKIIFVHGCFWHLHKPCSHYRMPTARKGFWLAKLGKNRERDKKSIGKLRRLGWSCMVIWECQLKDEKKVKIRLERFLGEGSK